MCKYSTAARKFEPSLVVVDHGLPILAISWALEKMGMSSLLCAPKMQ